MSRRSLLGDKHPDVAASVHNLARVVRDGGNLPNGEEHYRSALTIRLDRLPAGHLRIVETQTGLGNLLFELGRFEEAEPLLLAAIAGMEKSPYLSAKRKRKAIRRVVELYDTWSRPGKANEYRAMLAKQDGFITAAPRRYHSPRILEGSDCAHVVSGHGRAAGPVLPGLMAAYAAVDRHQRRTACLVQAILRYALRHEQCSYRSPKGVVLPL